MKEKLLFISDLDGTLLQDDHTVSQFNKDAIQDVIKAGHVFCIATGRAWSETSKIYESTEIDTIVVTSNGSLVHSPTNNGFKEIFSPIGRVAANKVLQNKWMKDNIVAFSSPTQETVTFFNFKEELLSQLQYDGLEQIHTDTCEVEDEVISIIMMIKDDTDMDEFKKQFDSIKEDIQYTQWSVSTMPGHFFVEVNSLKCKEFGIRILSEHYGIDQKNIITFGDQMNDYTMTKWAGQGYVMQNGHPGLKEVAYEVLEKTNMEHGVGHKMLEIIKGNN